MIPHSVFPFIFLVQGAVLATLARLAFDMLCDERRSEREDKDFWANWWKSWEPFYAELAHQREMERIAAEARLAAIRNLHPDMESVESEQGNGKPN